MNPPPCGPCGKPRQVVTREQDGKPVWWCPTCGAFTWVKN